MINIGAARPTVSLLVIAALMPATAGAADGAVERSPVALTKVRIDQDKRQLQITLGVERKLPALRNLQRFPARWDGSGRHLCVAIEGPKTPKRLYCVGGASAHGRVRVGVSRYSRHGLAKKVRGLSAGLDRRSGRLIVLRLTLAKAGMKPGRFRYFGVGAWRGSECATDGGEGGQCFDRRPATGRNSGRIFGLRRVGCTGGRGTYFKGDRSQRRIALSFDDGPSAYTSQILDALDRRHAKATFFEVGNQTGGYDGVMRRIVGSGHEIANHSYAHEQYPGSPSMAKTNRLIRRATGFRPCIFRPPYGSHNSSVDQAARDLGMSVALWNIDTEDYRMPGSGAIYARAMRAGSGSIVLMHDGGGNRSQTVAAVPSIVHDLRSRGYRLVTVTELMGGRFEVREDHGRRRHRQAAAALAPPLIVPNGENPPG